MDKTPILLEAWLPFCAAEIRRNGYVSKRAATEQNVNSTASNATDAYRAALKGEDIPLTLEDRNLASYALAFLRSEDAPRRTAFDLDLIRVAEGEVIKPALVGFAAYIIPAYQKAEERDRLTAEKAETQEWYGTEGHKDSWNLTLVRIGRWYISPRGFEKRALEFVDGEGRKFTWYSSSNKFGEGDEGQSYALSGTIQKHITTQYGDRVTVLSRCRVKKN